LSDPRGEPAAQLSRFLGHTTNNVAEYQGLLLGLKLAQELGAAHLEIVSDSELVVKQIKGEYRVKSPHLAPLWREARTELQRFESYTIRHAPREQNRTADRLANEAIDRGAVEE
jgi:ribonuclease HI